MVVGNAVPEGCCHLTEPAATALYDNAIQSSPFLICSCHSEPESFLSASSALTLFHTTEPVLRSLPTTLVLLAASNLEVLPSFNSTTYTPSIKVTLLVSGVAVWLVESGMTKSYVLAFTSSVST